MTGVPPHFLYYGLDQTARELIHRVCGDTPDIELAPLDKGLSGSLTLMGRWFISGTPSKFHVFKIGEAAKLRHEYDAITKIAAPLVRDFPNVTYEVSADGRTAILSQEFLGDTSGRVRSLKQFIEGAQSPEEVSDAVRRLYSERLIHWIPSVQSSPAVTTLGIELKEWLRRADLSRAIAEIGAHVVDQSIQSRFGFSVQDIPRRVQSLASQAVTISSGPVHGDLHAQNVVLDSAGRLNLIDFGWTGIRWRAIDYLWLECSLKFVVCTPYAQLDDLIYVDELADANWENEDEPDLSRCREMWHGAHIEKIAAGICHIRYFARQQVPLLDLPTYQKGLALMSYSLTTFPQLNRMYLLHSVARYLSLFNDKPVGTGPYDRLYGSTEVLWPDRPGRMVRRAVGMLQAGRALDLGCGDGKNLVYLEDNGWTVTGVDISDLALEALKRRAMRYWGDGRVLKAIVDEADVATYPYPAMEYDLVVAYGLFHCLSDEEVEATLAGILKCLKPGGMLAFASFNDQLPVPDDHETGHLYLRSPDHIFSITDGTMDIVAKEIGFIEESHLPLVGRHRHGLTWAILRKP